MNRRRNKRFHSRVGRLGSSARTRWVDVLRPDVSRAFEENFRAYGVRNICQQLRRERYDVTV